MQRMARCFISFLILCILFVWGFPPAAAYAEESKYSVDSYRNKFEKVCENDNLVLLFNKNDGVVGIQEKDSGRTWWSNPIDRAEDPKAKGIQKMQLASQLMVECMDQTGNLKKINSSVSSIKENGMEYAAQGMRLKVVYRFPEEGLVIPLEYQLQKDSLTVRILASQIRENEKLKIINISLLPFMGAGGVKDSGYMLVPDGSGALIQFNNGKAGGDYYSQRIYGKDPILRTTTLSNVEQEARLPVFGIKNRDGAMLAVISEGEALGTVKAYVSGMETSYNNVFCEFRIREIDSFRMLDRTWAAKDIYRAAKQKTQLDTLAIKFFFMGGQRSDYSGMAQKFREYLREEKGLKKQEDLGSPPLFVNLTGGILKQKHFLGIPYKAQEALTTYPQSIEILKTLRDMGVEKIVFRYSGWTKAGVSNSILPVETEISSLLGGEKKYKQLVNYVKEAGVDFYPEVDLVKFSKSGRGYSIYADSAKTVAKTPALQFLFKLNTFRQRGDVRPWYLLSPGKWKEAALRMIRSNSKYWSGLSLKTLGDTVYSDCSKNFIDRGTAVKMSVEALDQVRKKSLPIAFENPNAYALPYSSHLFGISPWSSNFDIEDETVPFYQMVLHGYQWYSVPELNLSSDPELLFLKAIETGSSLYYSWTYKPYTASKKAGYTQNFSPDFRGWLDHAVEKYKSASSILAQTADQAMVKHEKMEEGVYRTLYENGLAVYVNYNNHAVSVNGMEIGPRNYAIGGV